MARFEIRNAVINDETDRPCIMAINPNASAYDAVGEIILIGRTNYFVKGSDAYKAHDAETRRILQIAADALNRSL